MYVYSHSKYGKLYQVVLYNLDYSLNEYESNVACIDVTIPFFLSCCHLLQSEHFLSFKCIVSDAFFM